jgi:hypothetical protein
MRSALDLKAEQPSVPYQSSRLFQAVDNLKAAHETQRPNAIVTLVYDALRAAVDVHANQAGLKVSGKDQHQHSVEYANSALRPIVDAGDLETYDELRLVRNRVLEYPPIGSFQPPTKDEAARYLASADRFVSAIDEWWRARK